MLVILFISYQFIKITRQIKNNVLLICLILPGFFLIFLIVIGFKFNIYFSITIDGQNGKIYIKSIKIFCFIFKLKKISIKNFSNILIENNSTKEISINEKRYYYLEVNFNLIDEIKISCNTLIKNIKEEGNKLFNIFSNSVPNNIGINKYT